MERTMAAAHKGAARAGTTAATPLKAAALQAELRRIARPAVAKTSAWYFKTGPGEYGEGDQFIGVKVPDVRRVARGFRELPLSEVTRLLESPVHEDRLAALVLMVAQFERGDEAARKAVFDQYLASTSRINNWDLVDVSAPQIVGGYLADRNRRLLRKLAKSTILWERRIAILATQHFIRQGDFGDTLAIAEMLLADKHDLIHKATGWMLREVGKRDEAVLCGFLNQFGDSMPRTMLRYAIERLSEAERRRYMAMGSAARGPARLNDSRSLRGPQDP
jgi:3-methyladenine DNA glycosylase AlkD